jgi:integrase
MRELCPTSTHTEAVARAVNNAREYAEQAVARSTRRAYRSDWKAFEGWCQAHALHALPALPGTLVAYLGDEASRLSVATLGRRLTTISQAHKSQGFDSPTSKPEVRLVMAGIRRTKGTAQAAKAAILTQDLRHMVAALPATTVGLRDRALLLLGFAGALRRSELVALDLRDLEFTSEGIAVTIRRSKSDQEGEGRTVGIPRGRCLGTCPVEAVQRWLELAGIKDGPVFHRVSRGGRVLGGRLSAQTVALVVKRSVKVVGLDSKNFAGHSLRSGLATSAAAAGASEREIMDQTGHRSLIVARRYIRRGSLFKNNAATTAGL